MEARRNPKALDITLKDKSAKEIFNIDFLASRMRSRPRKIRRSSINKGLDLICDTHFTTAEM
jgi:hypothetical protein